MRKTVSLFIVFLLLTLNGCKFSYTEDTVPTIPIDQEKVEVKKEIDGAFKEFVWSTGEFKIKLPCDYSEPHVDKKDATLKEKSETFNCVLGNMRFSVSSKKSKQSLREEFEKIKKDKKAEVTKAKDFIYFDYIKTITEEKTTTSKVFPSSTEIKTDVIKNRWHLVEDNWLISFEVNCHSTEKNFCEDLMINKVDEHITEFFNSLKINK